VADYLALNGRGIDLAKEEPDYAMLYCDTLKAGRIIVAGSIDADGDIDCREYLRADGSVLASGMIRTGRQFGILAGLAVPRDQWLRAGYVCAPEKPARVLTGKYRKLSKRRSRRTYRFKPAPLPKAA
jgi:hypothetical protein